MPVSNLGKDVIRKYGWVCRCGTLNGKARLMCRRCSKDRPESPAILKK